MKVTELQIGDLVYLNYWDGKYPQKIHGINYNSWRGEGYCDWVEADIADEASIKIVEPIPLTAKILEKNGFYNAKRDTDGMLCAAIYRHEKGLVWHHYDKDYVRITNYGDNFQWYTQVSCKYVHELQHALRLCGLDDLANNFRI